MFAKFKEWFTSFKVWLTAIVALIVEKFVGVIDFLQNLLGQL